MITAERKPLEELTNFLKGHDKIFLVGCNECVTVCAAGGRKEVGLLASALKMAFKMDGVDIEVIEHTLERQCDPEYLKELQPYIEEKGVILSMACGCGVQEMAMMYDETPVFPALNTQFMGASIAPGIWAERCQGCGDCMLGETGGICPISRCAKQVMNGPCGGSVGGKCEINDEVDCAWQLIWDRLKVLGKTERFLDIMPAKDWRSGSGSGPRKITREDLA